MTHLPHRRRPFPLAILVMLLLVTLPAAAQDVIHIVNDRVGIGTDNPLNTLDIQGEGVTFNVKDTSTTEAPRILFRLTNNGRIDFNMYNTANQSNWQFSNTLVGFQINDTLSAGEELRLNTAGNLYLEGQVYASSSRDAKDSIRPVNGADILQRVSDLPLARWTYRNDTVPHIGPMAEDFHAAFAVGQDAKTLSPSDTSGVALAAIQELKRQVDAKDAHIDRLEKRLMALEHRLGATEAAEGH